MQIENGTLSEEGNAVIKIILPSLTKGAETFYICAKDGPANSLKPFVHQGSSPWTQVRTYNNLMPLWASILVILLCMCFSCLFSGLNLGEFISVSCLCVPIFFIVFFQV